MFNFLQRRKFKNGAVEDPRLQDEKLKDFRLEELTTAMTPVLWIEKPQEQWKQYLPIRNQDGAYSCVANSKALELGILNLLEEGEFVVLSPRDIYTRRVNQESGGMWGQDANMICIDKGSTLEALMPSDNKNETEINKTNDRLPHKEVVGKIFRAKNWIALPFNIDTIASILDTGKGVNVFFRFVYSEWKAIPVITTVIPDCHHSVVAIDYTLYQGKKALIIQDSWGANTAIGGRRIITEDWINPANGRITWASYFEDLSNWDLVNQEDLVKPKFNFEKDLFFGTQDNDVVMLQDCLKWLNLFPKTQISTGYFGGITRDSVKKFQTQYNIEPILGYVGEKTRAKLNEIF